MNTSALHQYVSESMGNESNICQIYAMKGETPFYEDCWRDFKSTDALHVMSVTKGVMALLIGIAIDKGYIKNTDQKVLDFFPEYTVKRGEKTIYDVTLRHLLTMTAPYKYRSEPWTKVCTSQDWTKAALDLLGGRSGITGAFKYASLGIQILSGIIEHASGQKCIDFANQYLFSPLDIPPTQAHGDSSKEDQLEFVMTKKPRKHEWYCDPCHTVTAGWGLTLSATDMAKIGTLCTHDGHYQNKSVISERWIREMTTPRVQLDEMFAHMQYGYLWYKPHKDRNVWAAIGDGGNIIYTDSDNDISIGVTGTFKPRIFDRVAFIENRVIPLVLS